MEPLGVVSEASWSSFDATMSVEESEMMAQLLGTYPFPSENDRDQSLAVPSMFWSDHVADPYYSLDIVDPTLYCCPQGNSSNISSFIAVPSDYESYYQSDSNLVPLVDASSAPMDYCISEEQISNQSLQVVRSNFLGDEFCLVEETSGNNSGDSSMTIQQSQPKRKFHAEEVNKPAHLQKDDIPTENPKKAARTPSNRSAKKAQKNTKPSDEDESNAAMNGQNPSCSSSEDNSNASQELNGGGEDISSSSKGSAALTSSGKTRAGRGSASDPQSLYARKRRERINERLRILQTLVPNGTKVDISTMLEEAVHYVKFLQLQIKLLSSDDLWMYAPLAYNGMDIGLDLKISLPKQ